MLWGVESLSSFLFFLFTGFLLWSRFIELAGVWAVRVPLVCGSAFIINGLKRISWLVRVLRSLLEYSISGWALRSLLFGEKKKERETSRGRPIHERLLFLLNEWKCCDAN